MGEGRLPVDPALETLPGSIGACLRRWAEITPGAPAIAAPGRRALSYGRLRAHIGDVLATLSALGVGRKDRVALVLPQGPEMAVAFLAVAAGASCAPLNPSYRAEEFEFYLTDLRAAALIVQSGIDSPVRAVARARRIPIIELEPLADAEAGIFQLHAGASGRLDLGAFAEPDDVALLLHTSGTTSRPKLVPLTHANLMTSAYTICGTLRLSESDRCLSVMPLFHIHGLIGAVLSSLVAGGSVACTPGAYSPEFFAWMDELHPTWYTAVPAMHHAILARAAAHREIIALNPLRFIRSSSAPLPARLMVELEEAFQAPVIESYGMTEAAHQVASNPLPPGVRKPGSVGVAAGPEVAIMDATGEILGASERGEIVIRGANVTPGYQHRAQAVAGAFQDGWFRTGDEGYLDAEGFLFITGRLKELINRGGEKIAPAEVEAMLMDHPAVAEILTFAVPHPELGEEVAAAVVLREDARVTPRELQEFAAGRLADFKVPRRIAIVDALPKNSTGKPMRVGAAERLGIQLAARSEADGTGVLAPPRTELERQLAGLFKEVLGVDRVGVHDDFLLLGGHSLTAARLLSRIREATGVELSIVSFFGRATVADVAKEIETSRRAVPPSRLTPIPALGRNRAPLSFGQERLWFTGRLFPDHSLYQRPTHLRFLGRLDASLLERSLNEIVRRHEALRTTIQVSDGQPHQVIHAHRPISLPVVDLTTLPEAERELRARAITLEETLRAFDLESGPLWRAALLRIDDAEHRLLLTIHHLVFDGWSEGVLVRELAALYGAFVTGSASPLPELPVQYADFARWQRDRLTGEVGNAQLAYWTRQLEGLTPIQLDTDRPRPITQTFRGAAHEITLAQRLTRALRTLGQREGATLFMVLLAAFKLLLSRHTGRDDIAVGTPIANRNRAEIEGLIGFFVNTLVLRTDLSGNPTFRELLARVRRMALDAYAHQDLPFEKLVEELHPDRDLSRTPLFQAFFNMLNVESRGIEVPGLRTERFSIPTQDSNFDLTLYAGDRADGIHLRLVYNTDLFQHGAITSMLDQLQHLLERVADDPERPVQSYSLVTPQSSLLLSDPARPLTAPRHEPVTTQFASWAMRTPDRPAVRQGSRTSTYGELAELSEALARGLVASGFKRGDVAAVHGGRSVGLVASMLGVLFSGGVLLPIDPRLPLNRKRLMIREAGATRVLWVSADPPPGGERFSLEASSLRVLQIDPDTARALVPNDVPPVDGTALPEVDPDDPAYIFFTSGTTGAPRGVLGGHKGLSHFLDWQRDTFEVRPDDRCAQLTALSFDVVLRDVFLPLTSGALLCLPEQGDELASERIFQWLEREGISLLHTVPTLVSSWLAAAPAGVSLRALKRVFFAGEPLTDALIHRWRAGFPESGGIVNLYGPTETTLAKCFYVVPADPLPGVQPVGTPLPNTQALVFFNRSRQCGIGEVGEIVLRTPFRTLGYINLSPESDDRFLKNPFTRDDQDFLYFTGDRGRVSWNGHLEILGRLDHQVKIRGVRVEPDEVAALLARHPSVRSCVVVGLTDAQDRSFLAAYLVPKEHDRVDHGELRAHLSSHLPLVMIPSSFVVMDRLPLTPNGKVDRRALPSPDGSRPEPGERYVAPRTPLEREIADVWKAILGMELVGIHDNFFELGGHSLSATQVIARLERVFQVRIPLRALFERPTVEELSVAIEGALLDEIERLREEEIGKA